jgi:hypothetical protein
MNYAPILVSVYNRKNHFKNCINSLKNNLYAKDTILYVVSDNASKAEDKEIVDDIRKCIKSISGFKKVIGIFNSKNLGSHESVKRAIQRVIDEHGEIIFLEDDIIVSKYFLKYMNDGLNKYKNDSRIFSICAYTPNKVKIPSNYSNEVYMWAKNSPWGFGTWSNRWNDMDLELKEYDNFIKNKEMVKKFKSIETMSIYILKADREGKIKAMDVRISFNMFINKQYSIYPIKTLSKNTGFDGTGEHCEKQNSFSNEEVYEKEIHFPEKIEIDKRVFKARRKYYVSFKRDYIVPIIKKVPIIYKTLKAIKNTCGRITNLSRKYQ